MKQFLLLYIVSAFIKLSAQNFTNGSVYDYSVGDTIVTEYIYYDKGFSSSPPPTVTYAMFKNKTFSANLDTVFYTADEVRVKYCAGCPSIVTSTTTTFFITDLDSSAINFAVQYALGCQKLTDTSFINSCGSNEHDKFVSIVNPDSCFEPPIIKYRIIEGVGVLGEQRFLNSAPYTGMGSKTSLLAYSKGNQKCGSIGIIPTSLSNLTLENEQLKVYPNPSYGLYTLDLREDCSLSVQNILGEEILAGLVYRGLNVLNLENQIPGVYIVKCKSADKIFVTRIVKE